MVHLRLHVERAAVMVGQGSVRNKNKLYSIQITSLVLRVMAKAKKRRQRKRVSALGLGDYPRRE